MILKPNNQVAGACIIRNAVDLVPFLCGHYLRAGFAHLSFIDDGSSDGTFESLTRIARRTGRIEVRRVQSDAFRQAAHVTEAANALIRAGYSIVVPFDADEFWNLEAAELKHLSADAQDVLFQGQWINFVQARTCVLTRRRSLLSMRYQASATEQSTQKTVCGYSQSFVCHVEKKIAFKTRGEVRIGQGQHNLLRGPNQVRGPLFEIFHLPLRSRTEIVTRGTDYEPRRAPMRTEPGVSWQSAFHKDVIAAGRVDAVWAANSYDSKGQLDVYGKPLALMPDNRLRGAIMRAAWHLFSRYGLLPYRPGDR